MPKPWEVDWSQGRTVGKPNPAAQYEAPKAAADVRNVDSTITDRTADNAREDLKLKAELFAKGLRLNGRGELEQIPNWTPPKGTTESASRTGQLRDRVTALNNLGLTLGDLYGQYDKNFRGQPLSRLGGLTEMIPGKIGIPFTGYKATINQPAAVFNSTGLRAGPFIQSILGLTGKEADAAAEYERKVMPFIPQANDSDAENESKLQQMTNFYNNQRAATYRELGLKPPAPSSFSKRKRNKSVRFDQLPD